MLYDPKWEVKSDVLSLESLIAWLETQPADKVYCYSNTGDCLHHQYFTAMGMVMKSGVGGTYVNLESGKRVYFSDGFIHTAAFEPHTFGAALDRAREAAASA
jgi:hypothetical protein